MRVSSLATPTRTHIRSLGPFHAPSASFVRGKAFGPANNRKCSYACIVKRRTKLNCSAASSRDDADSSHIGRRACARFALGLASSLVGVTRAPEAMAEGIQSFVYTGKPASSENATQKIKFRTLVNEDSGFEIAVPEKWVLEVPGGRQEYHAPGDYGGKRLIVEILREPVKLKEPSFSTIFTPEEFARKAADRKSKDLNQGASAQVLATGQRENGRYYYFEYRVESFEPQRVWGVAAVGLGQSASARKFKLRQQVIITCQMPEKEIQSEADSEILRQIVASFNFTDEFAEA